MQGDIPKSLVLPFKGHQCIKLIKNPFYYAKINSMQSSVELYCIVDFVVPALVTVNLSLSICPAALAKTTLLASLLPTALLSNVTVKPELLL